MQSYDYANRAGVLDLTWEDFARLSARLAEALAGQGVQAVIGLARAGLFPAAQVAAMLRCELHPARLTRRLNDQVVSPHPLWKTPISPLVAGQVVAVIDEIADSGETLRLAAEAARQAGAAGVVSACLVSHSWADPAPDVCALVSDALVLFPWDRRVWTSAGWQPNPELAEALQLQGFEPGDYLPAGQDWG